MKKKYLPLFLLAVASSTLLLPGCFQPTQEQPKISAASPLVLPKPGPRQVLVDTRWAYSADENRPETSWLLQRARELASSGRAGLKKVIERWPDVALELSRESLSTENDASLRLFVADIYDEASAASDHSAGWADALSVSSAQRAAYAPFVQSRLQVLSLFKEGRFTDAAKILLLASLPANAPATLRVEALRLSGLAALLDNKPDPAAEFFNQAVTAAAGGPHQILFELNLLLTETENRRNNSSASVAAWKAAAAAGASVRDPELWERAFLIKPPAADWPIRNSIGAVDAEFADLPSDAADIRINIGTMYLSRQAYQPALLAFSRAEADTNNALKKSLAILYRTQAMISLNQAASALPMLEGLTRASDPRIASRARAFEGEVLCRNLNDRRHGIPLLADALQNSAEWTGKSQLAANLGLYLILEGRQEEGLRQLHQAQTRFENAGQWQDLATALGNEAALLKQINKPDEAAAIQKRADDAIRKSDS